MKRHNHFTWPLAAVAILAGGALVAGLVVGGSVGTAVALVLAGVVAAAAVGALLALTFFL